MSKKVGVYKLRHKMHLHFPSESSVVSIKPYTTCLTQEGGSNLKVGHMKRKEYKIAYRQKLKTGVSQKIQPSLGLIISFVGLSVQLDATLKELTYTESLVDGFGWVWVLVLSNTNWGKGAIKSTGSWRLPSLHYMGICLLVSLLLYASSYFPDR